MSVRNIVTAAVFAVGALSASVASAAIFVVDAAANSAVGGAPLATISVSAGTQITVTVATTDLWSAGALPRWSNANGLVGNLFATGTDESGEAAGTLIGQSFGNLSQNSLSAPFGSLVGELGGTFFFIGTNYSAPAIASGTLNLYYWDSNASDNFGSISADVTAVPEPATWAMLLTGFGLVGLAARRHKTVVTA